MVSYYYDSTYIYKLRNWIEEDKLNITSLCSNECPGAMHLIKEKFLNKMINDSYSRYAWENLSKNPTYEAVSILEQNMNKINWYELSKNTSFKAIKLIKDNIDKSKNIGWSMLSANEAPEAINLLKENLDKIYIPSLCRNKSNLVPEILELIPNAISTLDYFFLTYNNADWALDFIEKEFEKINSQISISNLCANNSKRAMKIIEKNLSKVSWNALSKNNEGLDLLEKNKELINIDSLVINQSPRAIKIIEEFIEKRIPFENNDSIDYLSENPCAIEFLEKHKNLICWARISKNREIFEINKQYLKKRMDIIREDLCKVVFHPRNEGRLWSIEEDF